MANSGSASGRYGPSFRSERVSIVIPTYNRAEHLREAIDSAIQQTYENLEIIVLDDASTDATPDVVASFDDSRIRYIRHSENLGPNENWRCGIEAAEGDFFCILPDDDVLQPRFVQRLSDALRDDPDLILAFSDHWVMDKNGKRRRELSLENSIEYGRDVLREGRLNDFAKTALIDDSIYIGATLFRRAFVPPDFLNSAARSAMGGWILYECVRTGRPATYVPERLTLCRWHEGSVSRSQEWLGNITEGNIERYRRMLEDEDMDRFQSELKDRLATMLRIKGRMHLLRRNVDEAQEALAESLQLQSRLQTHLTYTLTHFGSAGPHIARFLRQFSS